MPRNRVTATATRIARSIPCSHPSKPTEALAILVGELELDRVQVNAFRAGGRREAGISNKRIVSNSAIQVGRAR